MVKLSNQGKELADKFKANLYAHIGDMIDKIGMDRMLEVAAVSNEIQSFMKKSMLYFPQRKKSVSVHCYTQCKTS